MSPAHSCFRVDMMEEMCDCEEVSEPSCVWTLDRTESRYGCHFEANSATRDESVQSVQGRGETGDDGEEEEHLI